MSIFRRFLRLVNKKDILISLLLPISACIILPTLLFIFIDLNFFYNYLTFNIYLIILGIIFVILGVILFIKCNLLFFRIGKGTLMPISKIETKNFVIKGPYAYIRHPMISSVISIILGESLILSSISILLWCILFFIVNLIYFPLIEEKKLVKKFGNEYLEYKQHVRAWIPRLKPYKAD
ncbi:MAG: isoprenylcysteine carboxylmethyltransferase family protein [Candidatus Lokiarchaeota archaeon]|nr:isoprenylcysteine carboxylmethyltransferase family protein [Candidatus Lokiarchaeota archaeon]